LSDFLLVAVFKTDRVTTHVQIIKIPQRLKMVELINILDLE